MFRLFDKEKDLDTLNSWAAEYNLPATTPEQLSSCGLISESVAGFLYQTDSNVCYIENLIAKRHGHTDADLEALVRALEEVARSLGYTYILGYSRFFPVVSLGKRLEYSITPRYSMMSKKLG